MELYTPIFTITPEILSSAYEIAADLERIDIIKEKALTPQLRKENRIKTIHPFSDGNGRMGRMWQTLLLYQENPVFAWLPVENIIAQNQQEYYRALRRSTHHNNSGIFVQFMLLAIKQATAEFKEKYQNNKLKNADVNAGVKLSKTQEKIVTIIAKNNSISQSEIAKKLKISDSTVYRNIEKLKQLEILERKGSDKTGIWAIKKQ
jgi:Fic family protein